MSASGKKRRGMPAVHGSEVNVTPLIDVVMCLIIFFMLVAKIGVSTGAKNMDLPFSYLGKTIDDMGNTLTLNILPVGDLDKIKKPAPGERPMLPREAIVSALVDGVDKDLPVKAGEGAGASFPLREVLRQMKGRYKEQFKVIIRADSDLPFHLIQPVLSECVQAGATNVNFTTNKGEDPANAAQTPTAAAQ